MPTVRQKIITCLEEGPVSAREISALVGIREKEVAGHLEHIRKTFATSGRHLVVVPAHCKHCGYSFKKREKLSKPGKCPVCQESYISEPLFAAAPAAK